MNNSSKSRNKLAGVTLVELLVVVAILSLITAIMIPRLRVINKDRNIREAARQVASTLAKASNRSIDEGVAGFVLERHPNFVDDKGDVDLTNDVHYAGTRMYIMRRLPPFAGDDANAVATVSGNGTAVQIIAPLEQRATGSGDEQLIRVGDEIRLNHNSVRYRITNVPDPTTTTVPLLNLTIELGITPGYGVKPQLEDGDYPFVIYRQPRKLPSSLGVLPDGYYVDFRLSGPLVPAPATPPVLPDWEKGSVFDFANGTTELRLLFNDQGAIDRFIPQCWALTPIPTDSFYFFVTNDDPELSISVDQALQNTTAKWVTVDKATGSVNVASNIPPPATLTTLNDRIAYARGISRLRRSASQ